ncbi:hypothetical protein [Bacteroides sp. 519]|uniref:hypothetical protein n=1 Tax=Bacteroides sp. 519 TaxID=2302937 RepID=UPI0013D0F7F3|nr:hypothetical protein [Bacteroides sp. 519]NDV60606.1 hypothetical protein [Bacteroides sp. 519]
MVSTTETYWVIVTTNGTQEHSIHITEHPEQIPPGKENIVHARSFDDFLVAVGYRNILRQLSPKSLIKAIRKRELIN